MKELKLYIEVVYSKEGRSELRIVREYVKGVGIGIGINYPEYEILSIFKNNFLGKIKAKRELNKWKKYHKAHNFT